MEISIPVKIDDTNRPYLTSGLLVGTPTFTTRPDGPILAPVALKTGVFLTTKVELVPIENITPAQEENLEP